MPVRKEPQPPPPHWETVQHWQHSNGGSLEAADVWLLIAYSAQGSCELHETGLLVHKHLNTVSMAWLARSVWPLLCG